MFSAGLRLDAECLINKERGAVVVSGTLQRYKAYSRLKGSLNNELTLTKIIALRVGGQKCDSWRR